MSEKRLPDVMYILEQHWQITVRLSFDRFRTDHTHDTQAYATYEEAHQAIDDRDGTLAWFRIYSVRRRDE